MSGARTIRPSASRRATSSHDDEDDGEDAEEEVVESVGGDDVLEEVPERAVPAAPPVQDPGSHQAPPGDAGAGRQGRARQQGRGADDLSVAGRPLCGADAQHRPRRRHQPQDHLGPGPLAAEGSGAGSRRARGHGHHPAHRRRLAHQARDQARLRISDPDVGDRARHDAEVAGADPRLRGRLADQALAARPLQQGDRRDPGRRRSRLPAKRAIS